MFTGTSMYSTASNNEQGRVLHSSLSSYSSTGFKKTHKLRLHLYEKKKERDVEGGRSTITDETFTEQAKVQSRSNEEAPITFMTTKQHL
jgi:hypothetical protein